MNEFHLYIDDSGTRNPDRNPNASTERDWFALGGILIDKRNDDAARQLHAAFLAKWPQIKHPLHSEEIRWHKKNFRWIGKLSDGDKASFFADLTDLMIQLPVMGTACVIDRPGYHARYHARYGQSRWSLCKTAFTIAVERAAKFAANEGARLRVFVERSDKQSDQHIAAHYKELKEHGMPFASGGDPKYRPLPQADLNSLLYELKFKNKTSPLMQIADLYLYPMCLAAYKEYPPMQALRLHGKLIDSAIHEDLVDTIGIKYSCFELEHAKRAA